MKSVYMGLCAGLFCSFLVAACGSDSKATDTKANCTAVTDADLLAAGFLADSPNACGKAMFAAYKEAGFKTVNDNIGALALAAPTDKLGDSFQTKIADANSTRQAEFGAHLLSFLESAYGSPTAYTGPDMVSSHQSLAITIDQYKYFINDVVVPALTKSGVTASDISNCFAPTVLNAGFVKTVVTCK